MGCTSALDKGLGKEISKRGSSLNILFVALLELSNSFERKKKIKACVSKLCILISFKEPPLKEANLLGLVSDYHNQVLPAGL